MSDDRKLRELWSWMKIADQISTKLSKIGNADYSFHGVYGIWTGSQGRTSKSSSPASTPRVGASPKLPRQTPSPLKLKENDTTATMAEKLNDTSNYLPMVETAKSAQRNLALSACGFGFDVKGFERELVE